jgi:two-component system chemotaxis response regulator CheB
MESETMTDTAAGKIKVLVVDDSLMFREFIAKGIASDPRIEVVAKSADAFDARDKILEFRPDVMTCDINMPKMDGIEFIRRLLPQYALPVIVASTVSEAVLDALDAGAVEFVVKPSHGSNKSSEEFIKELTYKIKIASVAKLKAKSMSSGKKIDAGARPDEKTIIAIGASTGGTEAIYSVLKELPAQMPGIVIVQHIPPVFSALFAQRLDAQTAFEVKEARSGDIVKPGRVLLAPGSMQMSIRQEGGKYKVECYDGERVNGHCPSVDVLFGSVAEQAGKNAIGIILTGMGSDGAKGLLQMRRAGARTIGQDEKSSVVYGMPRMAYSIGAVERQADLQEIPELLMSML